MTKPKGPVLIELDGPAAAGPDRAPPVPEVLTPAPEGRAMQAVALLAARPRSRLGRFFWLSASALFTFILGVAAWAFIDRLLADYPLLGWVAAVLVGLFVLASLMIALREWSAYARLMRLDGVHKAALAAIGTGDLTAARKVVGQIETLYAGRPDAGWGRARLKERAGDVFDADALLALAEAELMGPLDRAARLEIEAAARQVATVTAIVPLALADVAAALTANLRMIRRIAEIYGGRAGALGSWRLLRTVLTHLVATGAVAVGDDLIHSIAGGGLLSKLSRRFGEGVVNGALTARVGVAAIEVCRPLPFAALPKPRVTNLVSRALAGFFGTSRADKSETEASDS
jgi:putative membrane protein